MRVNEIMSDNVRTVPLTASANDAWEMMRAERIHHLVARCRLPVLPVMRGSTLLPRAKRIHRQRASQRLYAVWRSDDAAA